MQKIKGKKNSMRRTNKVGVKSINALIYLLVLSLFASACSITEPVIITNPPSTERGHLVSYSMVGSMTAEKVIAIAREEGDITSYANYDLDLYTIVYNSINAGELIEVSGLVFIPKNVNGNLDIVQNHHGTIIPGDDNEVPSTYQGGRKGSSEMYFVGATIASNGYIVTMPDYVGYGITSDKEHPYTVHHELAEVSVDMLRASRKLIETLELDFSNNVFLTGWSEGGGAGLATHKNLQERYPTEFNIKGSSLLAGPYDYYTFFKDILVKRDVADPEMSIYNWSIYALNNYYSTLNRDANTIWTYPVSNQIEALYVPSEKPADLFTNDFMDGVINETDLEMINAMKDNTLLEGWIPQGHLFFHSGTADFNQL